VAAKRTGAPRGEILGLLEAQGEVLLRARTFVEAKRVNAEARQLAAHDPVRLARLMMKRAKLEHSTGRLSQVLRWLTRARHALIETDTLEARRVGAEIDARYAAGLQTQGRNREAVLVASRAIREGEEAGAPSAIADAENMLGAALASLGRPGALDHWRGALGRFEEIGDLAGQSAALINLGAGEYFEGRWGQAVDLYQRAADLSDRLGDPEVSANSKMNVAEVLLDQGSIAHGERLLREALRVWRAIGEEYNLGFCYMQLGRAAALSGRIDEALANFEASRTAYRTAGASGQILEVDAREAECRLLIGDTSATLPRIQELSAELEGEGGMSLLKPLVARLRGYAMAQLGRLDEARVAFEASWASAHARGAEHEVALSLQGLARVARLRGEPWEAYEAETAGIFDRLGIRAVPAFPMAAVSQ
jgi:tetratricopeptide (TPR) repeat protein